MAENEGSSTLDRLRERRERLASAADELERAITRAGGEPARWGGAARAALDQVGAALAAHVEEVEAPGGLFAEVARTSPRLIHAVDTLRQDHAVLRERVDALTALAAADPVSVDAVREAALELLVEISRHRQRGADLLWERYNVDIGGGD
ncbi:MAG: hypothetical protein S0880_17490 [Actinomycetota bacterium]|nr:hypothetical protein [Actinomycetota bacterium]